MGEAPSGYRPTTASITGPDSHWVIQSSVWIRWNRVIRGRPRSGIPISPQPRRRSVYARYATGRNCLTRWTPRSGEKVRQRLDSSVGFGLPLPGLFPSCTSCPHCVYMLVLSCGTGLFRWPPRMSLRSTSRFEIDAAQSVGRFPSAHRLSGLRSYATQVRAGSASAIGTRSGVNRSIRWRTS